VIHLRHRFTLTHVGGLLQAAMRGIALLRLLTIECGGLPSPRGKVIIRSRARPPRTNQENADG
jgi:hypothetical protein